MIRLADATLRRSAARLLPLGLALAGALAGPSFADDEADRGGATGAELLALQTAMDIAQLDTSVYHTIENLDDLPPGSAPTNSFDDIDNGGLGTPVLLPSTGRFATNRRFFAPGQWQGPYVTYQPSRIEPESGAEYDPGTLIDFFDTPYHLYSPLGLVDPPTESIVLDAIGDRFDRWAFVSAGPDGLFGTVDDAVRQFGSAPTETVMSGVVVVEGPDLGVRRGAIYATSENTGPIVAGSLILVRGYNFGATQGASRLLLDGFDLGPADSWSGTAIEIRLPANQVGSELALEIGGVVRDSFSVSVGTAAADWGMFE